MVGKTAILGALLLLASGCGRITAEADRFDPDAADSNLTDAQTGPGPADGSSGADLVLMGDLMRGSIQLHETDIPADDCTIVEGCVNAPGRRRLLRFDTTTHNAGTEDIRLGAPNTSDPIWEYSPCHGHYHFTEYANYELVGDSGVVATGHKQAFCLMDTDRIDANASGPRYHCGFQGISRGWADTYSSYLDCQWIDVTDVPGGQYTLRISINPAHLLPESNYDNNVFETRVTIN